MSDELLFRVYSSGVLVATCRYAEDAARLVCDGWVVRVTINVDRVVWREGTEAISAAESFDLAADVMNRRAEGRPVAFGTRHRGDDNAD